MCCVLHKWDIIVINPRLKAELLITRYLTNAGGANWLLSHTIDYIYYVPGIGNGVMWAHTFCTAKTESSNCHISTVSVISSKKFKLKVVK